MRWLLNLFGHQTEPPKPQPVQDTTEARLDKWVEKIVNEEFGDLDGGRIHRVLGFQETRREIYGSNGQWLAEVGFDYNARKFYRASRDYPYIGDVPHA